MLLARRLHLGKVLLFVALSGADLWLTWHLIRKTDGIVYESNPVAAWWMEQFGWWGLAAFKLLQVAVVATLALVIARRRPRLGGGVLTAACVVVACVVAYSVHLGGFLAGDSDEPTVKDLISLGEQRDHLAEELTEAREYRVLLMKVTTQLAAGEIGLPDAVSRLEESERTRNPRWLAKLHHAYPDRTDQECLASNLIVHVLVALQHDPETAALRRGQFDLEFRAAFGTELPWEGILGVATVPAGSDATHSEGVAEMMPTSGD